MTADWKGRWWQGLAAALCCAAAMVGLELLAVQYAVRPLGLSLMWPSTGVAVGFMLAGRGWRWWSWVVTGIVLGVVVEVGINTYSSYSTDVLYMVLAVAEPIAVAGLAMLLGWWRREGLIGSALFYGVAALLGTLAVSAVYAWGTSSDGLSSLADAHMVKAYVIRWLSAWMSVMTMTPLVVAAMTAWRQRRAPGWLKCGIVTSVVTAVVCWLAHSRAPSSPGLALGVFCLPLPLLLWAGLRAWGPGAGAAGWIVLACVSMSLNGKGGPLGVMGASLSDKMIGVQVAVGLMLASAHLLAGLSEDWRRAGRAAAAERAKYERLFEASHDAVVVFRPQDEVILAANRQACELYGLPRDELVGRSLREFTIDLARGTQIVKETAERSHVAGYQTTQRRPDGRLVHLECNNSRLEWEGEQAILGQARDVTARVEGEARARAMEAKLAAAARMESLGVLAGGVAHDFNNMLAVIMGHVNLAMTKEGDASAWGEHLKLALDATDRAAELTAQVLAYAGRDRLEARPADLGTLVRGVCRLADATVRPRATLAVDVAPGLAPVMVDASRLEQVLMNLIANAAESMVAGRKGRIDVRVRQGVEPSDCGWRHSPQFAGGPCVCIEVEDNGAGMSEEVERRMFEPFFSTKIGGGRGLGLAAALSVVHAHRGGVEIRTRPGEGTLVRVCLPAAGLETSGGAEAQAGEAPARSPGLGGQGALTRGGRALVVDDDPLVRGVIVQLMRAEGWEVDGDADGATALARVWAEPTRYGVVVLDLTMPGMSGNEVLRGLREANPAQAVVMVSGYAWTAGPGGAGVQLLDKPFGPDALHDAVARAIAESGATVGGGPGSV